MPGDVRCEAVEAADFYTGLVADAYGLLKGSHFDPAHHVRLVRTHGEPALELGCGDGDPLLALRAERLDVEGLDSSADMLDRCRRRAADLGIEVTLHHSTMEDMDLGRRYATVFLAGPTFNLLPDDAAAARALAAIARHLREDGVAVVPLWVPPPMGPDELGAVRSATVDGTTYTFVATSETYDESTRVRTTATRYSRTSAADTEVLDRSWLLHWYEPAAFASLARGAGLAADLSGDTSGAPGSWCTATLRLS